MSKTHELKIYPKYFEAILDGKKTFEIRKNNRNFHVGDSIVLREFDNIKYSGREIHATIKYMLDDTFIGLEEGYVAFSFGILKIIDR
jgi:ASC-1-like (ASCH) protein